MVYAKNASEAYMTRCVPMNDTIGQICKEAKLNREQAHRVVQLANSFTFRVLREKLASSPGNVDFDVADIDVVFPSGPRRPSYLAPDVPQKEKLASIERLPEPTPAHIQGLTLLQVFGFEEDPVEQVEKTAQDNLFEYYDHVSPARDLFNRYDRLSDEYAVIAQRTQERMLQALEDGERPTEVVHLMKEAGLSHRSMGVLTMDAEGLFKEASVEMDDDVIPAVDHPLYQYSARLAGIESELEDVRLQALSLDSSGSKEVKALHARMGF
jgi:hypothetical protein